MRFVRSLCLNPSLRLCFHLSTTVHLQRRLFSALSTARGQFGCVELFAPSDFQVLSNAALARSESLLQQIYQSPADRRLLALVDELSDVICQVVDVAEVCRHIHPKEEWVEAAQDCHDSLCNYLEQLNCNDKAHASIQRLIEPVIFNTLSIEEQRVTHQLVTEMKLRGVGLNEKDRAEVLNLQAMIRDLSLAFSKVIHAEGDFITVPSKFDNELRSACGLREPLRSGRLPNDRGLIDHVLRTARSEELRRSVYLDSSGMRSKKVQQNIENLDVLLKARQKLAELIGFPSFAHLTLQANMMQTPEQVKKFLQNLALRLQPKLKQEIDVLRNTKIALSKINSSNNSNNNNTAATANSATNSATNSANITVNVWDTAFLMNVVKKTKFSQAYDVRPYLSITNVLRGLNIIVQNVFSCSVEITHPDEKEAWTTSPSDIYKLIVRDITSREVQGVIYLDLWERPNKLNGAATFILKAGCRNHTDTKSSATYRIPECVVSCNFSGPDALHVEELETLFHEMGHATHTILARTEYQHLSGTRGPELDFVEIPSTLMEYFIWDYRVLSKFAIDSKSNKVLPRAVFDEMKASRSEFAAINTMTSTMWALLDQALHGGPLVDSPADLHAAIVSQYAGVPAVANVHLYSQFSHLTHYGAGYYCYLLSRVYAAQIWHSKFAKDPLQSGGREWRQQVLQYGGAREAKRLLTDFLGNQEPSVDFLVRDVQACT